MTDGVGKIWCISRLSMTKKFKESVSVTTLIPNLTFLPEPQVFADPPNPLIVFVFPKLSK